MKKHYNIIRKGNYFFISEIVKFLFFKWTVLLKYSIKNRTHDNFGDYDDNTTYIPYEFNSYNDAESFLKRHQLF